MSGGNPRIPLCAPAQTARMSDLPYTAWTNQPLRTAGMNPLPQPIGVGNSPQHPQEAPMSVSDMRARISANALVVFPHIVHSHNLHSPFVSPRAAQDLFEVSISLSGPHYIARLTHRQRHAPALHVLALDSVPAPTMQLALSYLLDTTCTMLGTDQASIIERPPGTGSVFPALNGAPERDGSMEMGHARACVTRLREEARLKAEAGAAGPREASSLPPNALSRQNSADSSSLRTASLPVEGQGATLRSPALTTATTWRSDFNPPASAASQARNDALPGSNPRPTRSIQTPLGDPPQTPTRSSRTGGDGASDAPETGDKEYCTYWLRHGECDFTLTGCRYKHGMPDAATLARHGFIKPPLWWKLMCEAEAEAAELKRVQDQEQNQKPNP